MNNNCQTWDNLDGRCLSCYLGYNLLPSGECALAEQVAPTDPGCRVWDQQNNRCSECSARWIFNNGVCVAVSDLCQTHNDAGQCLTCYTGYVLQNGQCVLCNECDRPQDLGCRTWDWANQICFECSQNWFFREGTGCVPINDQCRTSNENGECTACYVGYTLTNGACNLAEATGPSDLGCRTWDWDTQRCLECSARWTFNQQGICVAVNDLCATFDNANGACLSCYKGFELNNGVCVLSQTEITGPTDLGCKTWDWDNQVCLECSLRWTFNEQRVCVPISDLCQTYDSNGVCTACYKGYTLSNGACALSQTEITGPTDLGCRTWDWDNQVCLECSARWTFNEQRICVPVNDNCATFNEAGACLTCYKGFTLNNGVCELSQTEITGPTDLGCKTWDWDNQRCLECSTRWFFNNGVCQSVANLCRDFDATTGACTSCYTGYNLQNGQCVLCNECDRPQDLGCRTWDWANQICFECSQNWFFREGTGCVPVNDQCRTSNENGECTACYVGYTLINGACNLAEATGPSDLGCRTWDWENQVCLECSARWVFNEQRVCVPVNDNCATFDNANGACLSCYKGYTLANGVCSLSQTEITGPTDLGCRTWDWDNQRCLECSARWVFNEQRVCVPVNDNCATWGDNGVCLTCYKGFELNNGVCVLSQTEITGPTDLGCRTWDWDNQVCLECSARWVFNEQRVCVPINDNCATFDNNGACLTCYKGYTLANGVCSLSQTEITGPTDLGCRTWDWDNQVCLECSARWVLNNGVCVAINDLCATFDNVSGACLSCYKGYTLANGVCSLSQTEITGPTDLGCRTWDWDNQRCLECSARWTFNQQGVCVAVNDLCATFDNASGACLSCYKGYTLANGVCSLSQVEITGPTDLGCSRWDWDNQVCLECSFRHFFNANRTCQKVDDSCATWDSTTGACTSCYPGYSVNNGQCEASNMLCKTVGADGNCSTCYNGYVLYQNQCTPISSLASLAQYYAACCPEKLAELQRENRLNWFCYL